MPWYILMLASGEQVVAESDSSPDTWQGWRNLDPCGLLAPPNGLMVPRQAKPMNGSLVVHFETLPDDHKLVQAVRAARAGLVPADGAQLPEGVSNFRRRTH